MIHAYSPTIRRKEMEAVLTCMVDEKIGPGEMAAKLVQAAKETIGFDGGAAVRSPAIALEMALRSLELPAGSAVILSALAPSYQIVTVEKMGLRALVADVREDTAIMSAESAAELAGQGARALVLREPMGILPEIPPFLELGIPVIEDISQSALAFYPDDGTGQAAESSAETKPAPVDPREAPAEGAEAETETGLGARAGMRGCLAIMGMEDFDAITSGGGAIVFAPERKEWIALKKVADGSPSVDFLPDMNAALAFVELKEFPRNEKARKELFALYSRAVMSGRHRSLARGQGSLSTIHSFPLVLSSSFKDVKASAAKKGVEVRQAFEDSILALRREELAPKCVRANSLFLRTAAFPLYPRLGKKDVDRIVKVLASLP